LFDGEIYKFGTSTNFGWFTECQSDIQAKMAEILLFVAELVGWGDTPGTSPTFELILLK
jgi:hypothetical protein